MKFFVNGTPIDYSGAREEEDMYNWIQKKTGPSTKLLETDEDYEKHSTLRLSVLMYLPAEDEETLNAFKGFAAGYDDVQFAHTH